MDVYGKDVGTVLNSAGTQTIYASATSEKANIKGGKQTVYGLATEANIESGEQIVDGGSTDKRTSMAARKPFRIMVRRSIPISSLAYNNYGKRDSGRFHY
ncbi:ABC transporter ATP-binding protein [Escherichia coli]|uniref:ABC transporter ATP-binding protein n=1 Tax=Escherichia coli TaxID=562 RepID=A0A376SCW1_ECOLX|nr:ABC transporter ATP-binding protein [Escherichia coli]